MNCTDARDLLVDLRRDRLPMPAEGALRSHLAGCTACTRLEAAELALDDLLERTLPRRVAPEALKARLARMTEAGEPRDRATRPPALDRWSRLLAPVLVAGLAVAVVGLVLDRRSSRDEATRTAVVSEAVSDHLRALASARGFELESGDGHEVKPWFEGRLDFAPVIPAPAVADLRLRGGSVGYFRDRKAAVVGYSLRRHAVTLLAFRPDGLGLPEARRPDGNAQVSGSSLRGFRVATWREADIGYALVSDVSPEELDALAAAFASSTAR
jgi:anti-sigma factor RsiW